MGKGGPRKCHAPVIPADSGKPPLRDEETKRRISKCTSAGLCSHLIHWQISLNAESFSRTTYNVSFST